MKLIESIRQKLKLPASMKNKQSENFHRGEKAVVFVFAYVIALGMWMLINLDRDFSMTIQVPLVYGEFPANRAPVEPLPTFVRASVSGEGWKLLSLYGSSPRVAIDVSDSQIDVFQMVQTQLSNQAGVNVTSVSPATVRVRLDEKIQKKVPITPTIDIQFRRQFSSVGVPMLSPDSVIVSGARSLLENLRAWPTIPVTLSDLSQSVDIMLELEESTDLIRLSEKRVNYRLTVSEFTEGEIRVPVMIRGRAESRNFTLSPSSVMVRYDIPIGQFQQAQNTALFEAYVDFETIRNDASGFVEPTIIPRNDEFELRVRSVLPQRVSYFQIIQN